MEIRQLEYVIAVAEHGGFTKAAATLHVSQPSLSHGVRSLERQLGVDLFVRTGRAAVPTPAGLEVLGAARRVMSELAELQVAAARVSALETGTLHVIAVPTLTVEPLARLVGLLRARHPGIVVTVLEPDDVDDVEVAIRSGRAELGLTDVTVGGRGLVRVELFRQEIVAVSPPGTEIDGPSITAATLARLPLIATPRGTSMRTWLERAMARVGGEADVVVEISTREAIGALVLAGAGSALLPAAMAEDVARRGAVVRSLRPALHRRVGLLHRQGRPSPAVAALVAIAREAGLTG